jgi:hypothetical protein
MLERFPHASIRRAPAGRAYTRRLFECHPGPAFLMKGAALRKGLRA